MKPKGSLSRKNARSSADSPGPAQPKIVAPVMVIDGQPGCRWRFPQAGPSRSGARRPRPQSPWARRRIEGAPAAFRRLDHAGLAGHQVAELRLTAGPIPPRAPPRRRRRRTAPAACPPRSLPGSTCLATARLRRPSVSARGRGSGQQHARGTLHAGGATGSPPPAARAPASASTGRCCQVGQRRHRASASASATRAIGMPCPPGAARFGRHLDRAQPAITGAISGRGAAATDIDASFCHVGCRSGLLGQNHRAGADRPWRKFDRARRKHQPFRRRGRAVPSAAIAFTARP